MNVKDMGYPVVTEYKITMISSSRTEATLPKTVNPTTAWDALATNDALQPAAPIL
jgi:hypothetical protein